MRRNNLTTFYVKKAGRVLQINEKSLLSATEKKKAKRLDLVLHKEHIQMGNEHMKR